MEYNKYIEIKNKFIYINKNVPIVKCESCGLIKGYDMGEYDDGFLFEIDLYSSGWRVNKGTLLCPKCYNNLRKLINLNN